jgi:hypothetical protein
MSIDRRPLIPLVLGCALFALGSPGDAAILQMFVTSASGPGNLHLWSLADGLTGIAAGDRICQNLASGAGLANPADFRAWLSDASNDAFCHVAGFDGTVAGGCGQDPLPDAGPWVRVDGAPFSEGLQSLVGAGGVDYVPAFDEAGATVLSDFVYTGTRGDGTASGDDCDGWTSDSSTGTPSGEGGYAADGVVSWTYRVTESCNVAHRLYCFEAGTGAELPRFAKPGAYVFVTAAKGPGNLHDWPLAEGATGLAAGDAICRNSAAAAGLPAPESFVAWLSAGTIDAPSRLTVDGPWRRPNGVEIAPDLNFLTSRYNSLLESDIEDQEDGSSTDEWVYTGTNQYGNPTGEDCAGWTSSEPGDAGAFGLANNSSADWSAGFSTPCNVAYHLYCFSNVVTIFADGFEIGDPGAWSASVP